MRQYFLQGECLHDELGRKRASRDGEVLGAAGRDLVWERKQIRRLRVLGRKFLQPLLYILAKHGLDLGAN